MKFWVGGVVCFLCCGREVFSNKFIFQTLSPVSITTLCSGKTLISVLLVDQCIFWTLEKPN